MTFQTSALKGIVAAVAGGWRVNGNMQVQCMARRLFWVIVLSLTGCGPRQPALHPVSGVVLFEGRPVGGFAVEFSSQDQVTKGISAIGLTDSQGRFSLETRQAGTQKPGAVAGAHRVVVLPPPSYGEGDSVILPVPLRYADYATSGLAEEVQPDKSNEFRLELVR